MKNAHLVTEISPKTAIYKCDPPMSLIDPQLGKGAPATPVASACQFVAAHTCEVVPGVKRTVIHEAMPLKGDSGGWGYGGGVSLVADGAKSHDEMMHMHGYAISGLNVTRTIGDEVPQA